MSPEIGLSGVMLWGEIALRHEAAARDAVEAVRLVAPPDDRFGRFLHDGLLAAAVSVTAAAFAFEALCQELWDEAAVPRSTGARRQKGPRRDRSLRVLLDRLGDAISMTPEVRSRWMREVGWLLALRHDAVHYRRAFGPGVPHPDVADLQVSSQRAALSGDSAVRAVSVFLDVFEVAVECPATEGARQWAGRSASTLAYLTARRAGRSRSGNGA